MEIKYPSLLKRIESFLIDTILKLLLIYLATCFFGMRRWSERKEEWAKAIVFILVVIMYEPVSMRIGATLGNYITGIRVRRLADTSRTINLFQSFTRYGTKIFVGWLSCFTILFNKQRRALHDMVGESIVIEKTN